MTRERYEKINELFQAALEHRPEERATFLAEACAGDEELRKDVASLICSHEQTGSFIDSPAFEAGASLLTDTRRLPVVGEQVGPYKVLSLLGRGGMGEVYLAQDFRLNRKVALKMLPAKFTSDQDKLHRFQREARAASALNHPNILTIHDIGQSSGVYYIATEFIEGETLRQRLLRGSISVSQALDVAIQVAGALSTAHLAGIVHRDIKPENIMLRPDGYVKVLDFGIAKLTEQLTSIPDTEASTIPQVDTGPGVVMGTLNYMSPEQARGLNVDPRTDIWSLGVVLYETLAGRPPFEGHTASDVIAAILEKDPPPLARYSQEVPGELPWIVSKTLRKEIDDRYQSAKDLLGDLKNLKQDLDIAAKQRRSALDEPSARTAVETGSEQLMVQTGDRPAAATGDAEPHTTSRAEHLINELKRHKTGVVFLLTVFIGVLLVISSALHKRTAQDRITSKPSVPFQAMEVSKLTAVGNVREAAVSADGKYIVYAKEDEGQQSLWLKQVVTGSNVQIVAPTDGVYSHLTFSSDGNYIYYARGNAVHQTPTLGGVSRQLMADIGLPLAFSPDCKRISFIHDIPAQGETALIVINTDSSGEREIVRRKRPNEFLRPLVWSPDGGSIACAVLDSDSEGRYMSMVEVRLADGMEKPIGSRRWSVTSGATDVLHIGAAWASNSSIVMVARDRDTSPLQIWQLTYPSGEVRRVTNDSNDYHGVSVSADSNALVTVQIEQDSAIWTSSNEDATYAKQITFSKSEGNGGLDWTPDGEMVFAASRGAHRDIWIMDPVSGNQRQLTANAGSSDFPAVSSDGQHIVYSSRSNGNDNIWKMDIGGANQMQLTNSIDFFPGVSPDDQWVVYSSGRSSGPSVPRLWKVPMSGGDPIRLTERPSWRGVISPDGKLIACNYLAERPTEAWRIAVLPFEGGQPLRLFDILGGSLMEIHWTPDGRDLAYPVIIRGISNIWIQPVDGGAPRQWTNFKSQQIFSFGWSRDGKHLALSRGTQSEDVVLISNFR
jgi:serine/threonine protein kinase/Tol biopolymer transport system component